MDTPYGDFIDTEKPAYKIPADKNIDFLSELSKIEFSDSIDIVLTAFDPSFYYGEWTVCIIILLTTKSIYCIINM